METWPEAGDPNIPVDSVPRAGRVARTRRRQPPTIQLAHLALALLASSVLTYAVLSSNATLQAQAATNAPPEFADGTADRSVLENSPLGTSVGDPVVAADADNDALTYSISGTDASLFGMDIASGQIVVGTWTTLDYEARNSYEIVVTVTDPSGGSDTVVVMIKVTDVDLGPLASRYDANNNEAIDKTEIFLAVRDYFNDVIARDDVLELIRLYFSSTPTTTATPGSYAAISAIPWLADGVTKWERLAADSLRAISAIDTGSAALVLSFPWVIDGIAAGESSAISGVRGIVDVDPELAKEVLNLWWVPDDMPTVESYALVDLRDLARRNLALARQVIKEPFMEPPFRQRDEYALRVLSHLAPDMPENSEGAVLLAELARQPWFSDGLDDLEAALLYAIVSSPSDFRQALIETHYVASAPVTLPLAGDVELVIVRHTPFPPDDDTFATMEEGVRVIEGYMGAPFPVEDVILLITEPDIWSISNGAQLVSIISGGPEAAYITAHIRMNNSESGLSKSALYHEIAHHYYLYGPAWLSEGAAQFLEAYTIARTGGEELEQRLAYLESSGGCDRENLQQHIDDYGGVSCSYVLGEKFLLAMHAALGQEAVSAALRDLYTQSLFFVYLDEDTIYHAFLSNTPPGSEEAFKTAYRLYHGGPIVDADLADAPDLPSLVALYNATNGDDWVNNGNWVSDAPLGTWHGVDTEPRGRVRILDLNENKLAGEIPPELGSLSDVRNLFLSANSLVGGIPPELGSLSKLIWLRLSGNKLSGEIPPELGNLTNLQALGLSGNQLSGEIPPGLAGMHSMRILSLQVNQLTGEIPSELADLTNLESLSLGSNRLSGEIPSELGGLSDLTWLDLGRNQLVGGIPPELGNLSNVKTLRLWENRLSGSIPAELGNLTSLGSLELSNNQLSGEIPRELGNLALLRTLALNGNQFSGEIPSELGNLANFYSLDLSLNDLSGQIPPELGNLSGIKILDLSRNQLSGEIPPELGSLINLEKLFLRGNQFSGCIPEGLDNIPENDLHELGLPLCGAR